MSRTWSHVKPEYVFPEVKLEQSIAENRPHKNFFTAKMITDRKLKNFIIPKLAENFQKNNVDNNSEIIENKCGVVKGFKYHGQFSINYDFGVSKNDSIIGYKIPKKAKKDYCLDSNYLSEKNNQKKYNMFQRNLFNDYKTDNTMFGKVKNYDFSVDSTSVEGCKIAEIFSKMIDEGTVDKPFVVPTVFNYNTINAPFILPENVFGKNRAVIFYFVERKEKKYDCNEKVYNVLDHKNNYRNVDFYTEYYKGFIDTYGIISGPINDEYGLDDEYYDSFANENTYYDRFLAGEKEIDYREFGKHYRRENDFSYNESRIRRERRVSRDELKDLTKFVNSGYDVDDYDLNVDNERKNWSNYY